MSKLQLILLGRFDCLLASGTRISLAMRKAEALLAFLALAPGLRHPRERLINLLWSDRGEEQARNSLRQALSSIRKSLGDVADLILRIDRTSVSLNAELVEVDALEFERLALDGDYESLTSAADLYQGEFLEGIAIRDAACQEWLDSERQRFKRQFIEILFNLAETQLLSHDYTHAIKSAERLVEQDPLLESGWRLLMRSYCENGDRNHALQAYKRCQQVLRAELEVDPEPATVELRAHIAGGTIQTQASPVTQKSAPLSVGTSTDHSIAVLPFDNLSGDPEQEYFSDGITDSIILNLSLFPGLRVKSRNSSFAFKQQIKSIGEISRELGVDYIVEGSIRRAEDRVRITVQLIDTGSGNQIWGKRYDAQLDDLLDLEDEISRTIAATISGRIGDTLQRLAARKQPKNLQSYDYLLRGLYHLGQFTPADMGTAKAQFESCIQIDPDNVEAHLNLGMLYEISRFENWTADRAGARQKASMHLHRALEMGPENALVQAYLSDHMAAVNDFDAAELHADRALRLNPNSAEAHAFKAQYLWMTGRHEEAQRFAELCIELDPYSVGSAWVAGDVYGASGQYDKAVRIFRSVQHPPTSMIAKIAAYLAGDGQLESARRELERYLERARAQMPLVPSSCEAWQDYWRDAMAFARDTDFERFFDLLRRAGLCDETARQTVDVPSIAVLPFDNMSGDPEQEHFSDGITADIIDTLSKFRHLRTVARYSTLPYKADKPSIRDIADQQGVRYILEGSVRRSGDRIRVNAELIDSRDERILWSERYDRDLDDLFAVQDDITREIALAMKVQLDDGEMARVRSKGATDIKAWELTMTAVDLQDTYIRQNILEARALASEATRLNPGYAYAWISLGWTFWQEYYSGCSDSLDASIDEAEKAVRRAREIDPEYSEAYSLAGMIHLMKHEPEAAIEDCLKAVAFEPGNAELQALTAFAYVFAGAYDRASVYDRNIRKLCPLRANWYFLIEGQIEVAGGNLERAAEIYRQGLEVEPDSPLCRYFLVDLMVQMGDEVTARQYANEIRALDSSASARGIAHTYSSDPALREAFAERLRKFDLI